jgi:hypothetical protein
LAFFLRSHEWMRPEHVQISAEFVAELSAASMNADFDPAPAIARMCRWMRELSEDNYYGRRNREDAAEAVEQVRASLLEHEDENEQASAVYQLLADDEFWRGE